MAVGNENSERIAGGNDAPLYADHATVGNPGSARFPAAGSGAIPKGDTPVGNPATQPSGGSGPIPGAGSLKPIQ